MTNYKQLASAGAELAKHLRNWGRFTPSCFFKNCKELCLSDATTGKSRSSSVWIDVLLVKIISLHFREQPLKKSTVKIIKNVATIQIWKAKNTHLRSFGHKIFVFYFRKLKFLTFVANVLPIKNYRLNWQEIFFIFIIIIFVCA